MDHTLDFSEFEQYHRDAYLRLKLRDINYITNNLQTGPQNIQLEEQKSHNIRPIDSSQ
jgi:hypothetical protein